jgi:predicted ester cyclase
MSADANKAVARQYHDLNPHDVETILTHDFIGRTNGFAWTRDDHRNFQANNELHDSIHELFAEGDLVATRFTRTGTVEGKRVKVDALLTMRFVNGKIAEIWEYFDTKQLEQ